MESSLKFHSLLSFTLILAFSIRSESALDYGFTMELIHRDSQRSLYYNPADTPYQRTANAVRRSISRTNRLNPSSIGIRNMPSTMVVGEDGEYLVNISLGNPPVTIVGIADTGSDLIWTQCSPCTGCFKQPIPLFDPSKSSTFNKILCHKARCGIIDGTICGGHERLCAYEYSYGDKSYTKGTLATETLTLGSTSGQPMSFPTVIFGCGYDNGGDFSNSSGIVGLGGGDASLITQLAKATGGKFSYCLVPNSSSNHKISSKLSFGANAVVTGSDVVSTPLIQRKEKTFYYLTLEAVSVGQTRIEFPSEDAPSSGDKGNIFIDSGTTMTLLPKDFYSKIEAAMINSVKLPRVRDPTQQVNLCYQANNTDPRDSIPVLTFHFTGADVRLNLENSFLWMTKNIICFALLPADTTIYGNTAQSNYLIGYDIENMKLSFKPVDCTSSAISFMGRVFFNSYGLGWFGVLSLQMLMLCAWDASHAL